ncbi:MAG: metallophosphoesterase [Chthonomonadetes bacterium]|nr:metallophosphoesterase [Chthonomonadetes bacterium]
MAKFRFVHLSDIHVQPELGAFEALQRALGAVLSLRPRPAFITTGGDAIMDAMFVSRRRAVLQFRLLQNAFEHLPLPVYHAIGNHDIYGWSEQPPRSEPGYGKEMFKQFTGKDTTYFSFDQAHWHFIVLDNIHLLEPPHWRAEVDEAQLEWLRRDLMKTGKARPVVLIAHAPLFSIFPQFHWGTTQAPSEQIMTRNAKELRELFKDYNVKAVLQGHTHIVEECTYTDTKYVSCGAVSGEWWRGPRLGVHPEGFVVFDIDGDRLQWQYMSYGWKSPALRT